MYVVLTVVNVLFTGHAYNFTVVLFFCKAFAPSGVLHLCVTLTFFTSKGEWCDTKKCEPLMETQGQQQNLWRGNDHGCIF